MPQQLTFDWPTGVALGAEDFFVSDANAQAYAMLQNPDSWPEHKLALIGPGASGKSHLARVVQGPLQAQICTPATLPDIRQIGRALIVEDMHLITPDAYEPMFHIHNHLRHAGGTLLMTARTAPSRWPIALPDLASRMQAASLAIIDAPDDALLSALMMKLFADRQIMPQPTLISYLLPRIERSYDAAASIVARLDAQSLAQGRPVSRALAATLLDNDAQDG